MLSTVLAQNELTPLQVVDDFLASLLSGDTQNMEQHMSGRMHARKRQLALYPDTYSQFLQKHYTGVQPFVEELSEDGDKVRAYIRFLYPNSNSTEMTLVLRQIDGQWKITDEIL